VSLSSDSNTAIVGGIGDSSNAGAVWVFARSGGVWAQQGLKLVGSGGSAEQGYSVSLSGDGNTGIVGGPFDSSFAGQAWIWMRSGGVWTQQGSKLVGSGVGTGLAEQGLSVSISGDGNTAIIGGPGDNSNAGVAWVFTNGASMPVPATPSGVVALAITSTRVDVVWSAIAGATYQIDRQAAGDGFLQIGTPSTNSFSDTTASADSAYLYRVRAVNGSGQSPNSAADLATTVIFADSPLTSGTFLMNAVHLSQLRTSVNAVRLLAGLPAATFTDAAAAGIAIRAVHVTELRSNLDEARGTLGLSTSGYTDASLAGIGIKAVHFQELRDRVQ
jgi:hypothetical protein